MGFIRPATPGFLVTLIATILLAVVSFCVPYFKTIYFLKAALTTDGVTGTLTFGTLGYCLELSNGTTCSKPSIGYELDINSLVGDNLPIQIPQIVVKWVTYALFLHVVALILAAGSAFFGLLAHVREISMTCCSTFISGFAAVVALLAFIFDLAFFFLAKSRIDAVAGGSATIGNAVWLTLAAWVLLFFSGCFYTLGRCCISKRGPRNRDREAPPVGGSNGYAEQMRLDAVKAEADRKARQKQAEGGLPAFQEYEPLNKGSSFDEAHLVTNDYEDIPRLPSRNTGHTGYAQAPQGSRAVDEYYNPTTNTVGSSYPPQPQRQNSGHTVTTSGYAPSTYGYAPPLPGAGNQYLAAGQPFVQDPYGTPNEYGHTAGGITSASHQQYPSNYSAYDAYGAVVAQQPPQTYNNVQSQPFYPQTSPGHQPNASYTLGGGYGSYSPPHNPTRDSSSSYFPYPGDHVVSTSPAPINTNLPHQGVATSPVRGPRAMAAPVREPFDDSPPEYDPGTAQATGAWGATR